MAHKIIGAWWTLESVELYEKRNILLENSSGSTIDSWQLTGNVGLKKGKMEILGYFATGYIENGWCDF